MYHCRIKNKKVIPSTLVFTESVSFSLPFSSHTKSFVLSHSVSYRNQSCPRARTAVQRQLVNHKAPLIIGESSITSNCFVQIQYISHPLPVPAYIPSFWYDPFDCICSTYKSCPRLVSHSSYTRRAIRVGSYLAVRFVQTVLEPIRCWLWCLCSVLGDQRPQHTCIVFVGSCIATGRLITGYFARYRQIKMQVLSGWI